MSYYDSMIENVERARDVQPVREFVLEDLDQLKSIERAIYIIEEDGGDCEATFQAMSAYKKMSDRACPKLNQPSPVLYVGSSVTGIKKRIKQHLGDGPKGTYALHLSHWFTGKVRITIKTYEERPEVIQIIEDAISHELKPAFGKSGANNK
ncbi:GIY-YIG nuclease family protein [Alcanivorax sp.]|uniref:GIY-YIG nuclease family protein n=1 Tax=Alcanivorax sp. TaxID=1872427 RepID=UPI0032D8CBD8